jgi:hypothetical protein
MEAWQMRTTARVVDQFSPSSQLSDVSGTLPWLGGFFFGDSSVVFYLEFFAFYNSTHIPSQDEVFPLIWILGGEINGA